MSELAIKITGKETASRAVRALEDRFKGLGRSLSGVSKVAKGAAKALGTVAAATGALLAPLAALGGMAIVTQFLDRAKEQSNDLGREMARVAEVFNRVAETVGNFLAPFLSILADWLDKLVPKALTVAEVFESDFVKGLMRTAEKALRWGVNIVTELARGLIEGAKIAITAAMDFIRGMLAWFLQAMSPPRVAPDIDKWGMAAMESYLKGFTEADFSILEGIQGPLQAVLGLVGKGGQFAGLSQGIAKAIASGSGFERVLARLKDAGGKFGKQLAELARRHFAVAAAARAVEEAERRLEESRKAVSAQSGEVEKLRAEYAKLKKEGASPEILKAKDREIDAAQAALDTSQAAALQAEKDVMAAEKKREEAEKQVGLQERLLNQLTKLEQIQQSFASMGEKIGATVAEGIKGGIGGGIGGFDPPTAAFDELKEKIKSKLKDLFKPLKELWENDIQNFIRDMRKEWKQFKKDLKPVKDAFEEVWDPDKGFVANITDNVVPLIMIPFLDAIWLAIKTWAATKWREAWQKVKDFFSLRGGPDTLSDWLNTASFNLATWLDETWQDLYEGGRDIVQGLIDGIRSKLTSMVQSIRQMGQDILDAWNDFWSTHSPSKRAMDEMGKPIVEGIAKAFTQYGRLAQDPLNRMLSPAGGAAALGLDGAGAGYSRISNRTTTNNLGGATFNIYDRSAAEMILDRERRRRLAMFGG